VLPAASRQIITEQLSAVTRSSGDALTVGLVVSLLAALWSASSGTGNLITAVNLAYDEQGSRGFVKQKSIALGLTLGAIVFVLVALALVAGGSPCPIRRGSHTERVRREVSRWRDPRSIASITACRRAPVGGSPCPRGRMAWRVSAERGEPIRMIRCNDPP